MAFSVENQEAESLARKVASLTGEPLDKVVLTALRLKLVHERVRRGERPYEDLQFKDMVERYFERQQPLDDAAIDAVLNRYSALPLLDSRTADEILGYDENGLPG